MATADGNAATKNSVEKPTILTEAKSTLSEAAEKVKEAILKYVEPELEKALKYFKVFKDKVTKDKISE